MHKQPRIPDLHVGHGSYRDGVTVFPVWTDGPVVRGLDTGTAARVRVEERAGSPVVGELVVINEGTRPVLLLEGELLEGGWQHRTLVGDVVVPPGAAQVVEVACVEQGRWHGSLVQQRRARRSSAGVRSRLRGDEHVRQHAVWSQVASYANVVGATPTQSLADQLDLMPSMGAGPDRAKPLPGQRGVLLGVGGKPLLLELFGSTTALAAHLPGLLEGVRLDAATVPPQHVAEVPGWRARDMAAHLTGDPVQPVADAGIGVACVSRTSHADASGVLMPSGDLAHLTVLNTRHPLLEAS